MWLNLCQEGNYWDAAGLGGQVAEFSAEEENHGDGPADSFSAKMGLAWGFDMVILATFLRYPSKSKSHLPLKSIRISFHLNFIKLGLADRNTPHSGFRCRLGL